MDPFVAAIVSLGLPRPVPEHRFHPVRRWRFDLAWPARMVALERDGGLYVGGRHSRGQGRERDLEKLNTALLLGWRVLVVSPRMIDDGRALAWLQELLSHATAGPTEGPP